MSDSPPVVAPCVGLPQYQAPIGACDCHTHIFGPAKVFRPSQKPVYPLPDASPDAHARFRNAVGVDRAILVQPAPYGDDPSAMLSAIVEGGSALKGVAVAYDRETAPLERWAEMGIVGLRFTEMRTPDGRRYPGSADFEALYRLAPTMRALGLQAHLWASTQNLCEKLPALGKLGLELVIDHMGMAGAHIDESLFSHLLSHVRDDNLWIKLSVCRLARPDLAPEPWLRERHARLVDARPDRMLWGSDWPYVRMQPAPDAARLLDLLTEYVDDPELRNLILVDNPARAFGF